MAASESLDALVRRVDQDRWLASRFAPASARSQLVAIYALNHEIARAPEGARDPLLARIRLTWWREALDEIYAGKRPRAHPALEAYAPLADRLPQNCWVEIIEARAIDAERAQFPSWTSAATYVERTAGALMVLASQTLSDSSAHAELVENAALAWGLTGLARAAPYWAERGRTFLPGPASDAIARGREAYRRARQLKVPTALFPAFGYAALMPLYARALEQGKAAPSLLTRQLTLLRASLTAHL